MGGGHVDGGGDFRSKVWSMSGGPNCRPKHWRRNTAFALFGIFLVCVPIAVKSAQLEFLALKMVKRESISARGTLGNDLTNLFAPFLLKCGARILGTKNTRAASICCLCTVKASRVFVSSSWSCRLFVRHYVFSPQ
ncbi:hypothetical protein KSS87_001645 [Heliosperma pusillum]|nr:hypothetical protein KSS87_001645 [Heliosperma pusillum]